MKEEIKIEIDNKIKENEKELKVKQELLMQSENAKQQLMVDIFQLQGALKVLKELKEK